MWEEIWCLTDASLNRCSPIEKRGDDVIGKKNKQTKFVKLWGWLAYPERTR